MHIWHIFRDRDDDDERENIHDNGLRDCGS
jgi:hypothetical protein